MTANIASPATTPTSSLVDPPVTDAPVTDASIADSPATEPPASPSAVPCPRPAGSRADNPCAGSPAAANTGGAGSRVAGPLHEARTFADAQAELGSAELARALEEGSQVQPWWGVVIPERRMRDPLTLAAAALLRAGPAAVLSGPTAAAMHGCTAAHSETLHVTIPYDRQMRSSPGLSVRQAWVRESDVVELDGLRAQALDVALAEVLCAGPQRVALACLEQALGQFQPETGERLRRLVGERIARRRDRRGTRRAVGLLELAWAGGTPGTVPAWESQVTEQWGAAS